MLAHEKKIVMKGGILGFEEIEEFLLFASEYEPFYWLQSSPDKSVSFLVVDPFLFFSDIYPERLRNIFHRRYEEPSG